MNPFTQSLLKQVKDRQLVEFVTRWDAVEALVVRVYKGAAASPEDEAQYQRSRAWLLGRYPTWRTALGRYWPLTKAAGEPTRVDPFASLLAVTRASDFVENWSAMQTLPAARESINILLVDLLNSGK